MKKSASRRRVDRGMLAVRRCARKLDPEPPHVFQVCKNAMALFDATREIHRMGKADERLLCAAALLHDIGHTVGAARHHKHSRDLILKLDIPEFSDREKRIVACVARYHRKAHPSRAHSVFSDLNPMDQRRVEKLAALLRIADGLDRTHSASCKRLQLFITGKTLTIFVLQRTPNPIDIWGAQRKQSLFEEVYGVRMTIKAVPHTRPDTDTAP